MTTATPPAWAAVLRRDLAELDVTIAELARRAGVHRRSIERQLAGVSHPTHARLRLYARELGLDDHDRYTHDHWRRP